MQNEQHETGFFAGLRKLGIYRGQGWIGGVATAYANRLNIDVIIVRGVFVVGAILGLPFIFFYAASWLLLPDLNGRILLQEIGRGKWEPATFGAFFIAFIGLSGIGFLSWGFGAAIGIPIWVLGAFLWPLLLLAGLGVVIWAVATRNRPPKSARERPPRSPYMPQNPYASHGAYTSPPPYEAQGFSPTPPVSTDTPSAASFIVGEEVSEHDTGNDWNHRAHVQAEEAARQAEEKHQRRLIQQRYRMEQNETRRRELEEYRRKNPRITRSEILVYLGAAFLMSGIFGLSIPEFGLVGAFAVGLGVLAIGMVITGFRGRKSALLSFFAFVNVIFLVISALISGLSTEFKNNSYVSEYVDFSKDSRAFQMSGSINLNLTDMSSASDLTYPGHTYEINQFYGQIELGYALNSNLTVQIDIHKDNELLNYYWDEELAEGEVDPRMSDVLSKRNISTIPGKTTYLIGPNKTPDYYVVINQTFGNIALYLTEKTRQEWLTPEADDTVDSDHGEEQSKMKERTS